MKKMDKILLSLLGIVGAIVVLLGGLIGGYVSAPPADLSLGAFPGPEILERIFLKGGVVTGHPVAATTTRGTAATLLAADLINLDYHRVLMSNSTSGANFTYTFPASSTLGNFLSTPGESRKHCFFLYGTTSDSRLLFATGTGIDIRIASTTGAQATVPALGGDVGQETCFEFFRQPDDGGGAGDITAHIETFTEAD